MSVINIENNAQYAKLTRLVSLANKPRSIELIPKKIFSFSSENVSVVLFSADWAEQCSQILNVMNELAKQPDFKELQFINIPAEDYSEISLSNKVNYQLHFIQSIYMCNGIHFWFQIEAVPTIIYVSKSGIVDRIDGVDIAALTTKCKKYAKIVPSTTKSNELLEDRLKALINKSKLMIFMKGDRYTPRCGFSKQLIAIVNETGWDFFFVFDLVIKFFTKVNLYVHTLILFLSIFFCSCYYIALIMKLLIY